MSNAMISILLTLAGCSGFIALIIIERHQRRRAERELSKLKRELEALVERWK